MRAWLARKIGGSSLHECECYDDYDDYEYDEDVVEKVRAKVGRLVRRVMRFRPGKKGSLRRGTSTSDSTDFLNNEYVVDISPAIVMLDPDESRFTTLLMNLAHGKGYRLTLDERDFNNVKHSVVPGALIEYHTSDKDPGLWRVESVRHDDDWFSGKVFVQLRRPWHEPPAKIAWLEDEFFPRTHRELERSIFFGTRT